MEAGRKRISCAGLCRIQDEEQRYLLALNRNRLANGQHVLMALGGAIAYFTSDVTDRFEAVLENSTEQELRWFIDAKRTDEFRAWFYARKERELLPIRELREELVVELRAIPELADASISCELTEIRETYRSTERSGVDGTLTHYFHEIFVVRFAPHIWRQLRNISASSGLAWVTETEIRNGSNGVGTRIDASIILP